MVQLLGGRPIADVFDALTSNRPYRKEPFSTEQAIAMIKAGVGTHFDPAVAEAFFSITDEVLKIREQYKDQKDSLFLQLSGLGKTE